MARVAGLDANYTQATTFEEAREMARDLIALALDIDQAETRRGPGYRERLAPTRTTRKPGG